MSKFLTLSLILGVSLLLTSCASPTAGTPPTSDAAGAINGNDTHPIGKVKVNAVGVKFEDGLQSAIIIGKLAKEYSTRGEFEAAVAAKVKSGEIPVRKLSVQYEDGSTHVFN